MKWRILFAILFVTSVQQVFAQYIHVCILLANSNFGDPDHVYNDLQQLQDILSSGFNGSNSTPGELECINVTSREGYVVFHVCVSNCNTGKELLVTGVDSGYTGKCSVVLFINLNSRGMNGKYARLIFKNVGHLNMYTFYATLVDYSSVEFYNCSLNILDSELEFRSIQDVLFINSNFFFSDSQTTGLSFTNIDNLTFIGSEFSYLPMMYPTSLKFIVSGCSSSILFSNCHAAFAYHDSSVSDYTTIVFDFKNDCDQLKEAAEISFQNVKFSSVTLLLKNYDVIQFNQCEIQGQCQISASLSNGQIINSQFMNTDKPVNIISGNSIILTLIGDGVKMDIINTTFHNCKSDFIVWQASFCEVNFQNVTFSNNNGTQIYSSLNDFEICRQYLTFENVSFLNNNGLPIYIYGPRYIRNNAEGLPIRLSRYNLGLLNVNFTGNFGAIVVFQSFGVSLKLSNIRIKSKRLITHHAGGDIHVSMTNTFQLANFSLIADNVFFETTSNTNHAGPGIYIDNINNKDCSPSTLSSHFQGISAKVLKTSPQNIIRLQDYIGIDMFFGKSLYLPAVFKVTDCFGNDAYWCSANPTLVYNNTAENCTIDINHLDGPIIIETRKDITTKLYLTSVSACHLPTTVTFILTCDRDVSTFVNLTLRDCPLGYVVSNQTQQVVCQPLNDIVSDDSKEHIVCIERDYWYGEMNSTSGHSRMIKSPCGPPYCVDDKKACPINGYTVTHQILPWTQDEQCNGYYGGVLCRSCREQAVFTFGASKCIPLSECMKQWQPYLILCLAIVGQIVLTLVMICSRTKTTVGVGYLYGPLFFIAVYKLLPISNKYFLLTSPLEMTFSIYESILLLDLDVLGKVNWCFFNLDEAVHYSMRFIGPLIAFLVLLIVVLIAKNSFCYKFRINRIIQSPVQPMCLLIILSFFSISKISIEIIKPILINGEWRFSIQPKYAYLGNGYIIGLFCISVVLLTIFYLPFILILLSSQFIRRKINLFRIQPFLDAFQSSYKDNCQWFSGVYLLSWLILNTELPPSAFIIVSFSISAIHFTIQPHKSVFLNVADSLLLVDMLILSSLSYFSNEDHAIMVIKYPLLIIPLMYILMGGVWISIRGNIHKCINRYRYSVNKDDSVMQELMLPVEDVIDSGDIDVHENTVPQDIVITRRDEIEREPLIYDD